MLLVIGNWKMAPDKVQDAQKLGKVSLSLSKKHKNKLHIVVCPPFIHLPVVTKLSKALRVGAQGVAAISEVAQTGLVSAAMLKASGASYCIVGHSEERARGESNAVIAEKVARLLEKKLTPVICVGEKSRDHQGWHLSEIKEQLESALSKVPKAAAKSIVIAYEPVWAIGKSAQREATPHECREMIIYIRKVVSDLFDTKTGDAIKVLYGGSVDEKNAKAFIAEGDAKGLLVGRVSLDAKRFGMIVQSLAQ